MYGLWLYKELRTEYGFAKVEVFRKGYTASAIEIGALVGNSLNLALENLDTITAPIGKSVCSFSIYDTDQVEYDDLFTPDATAYKVVVSTKLDGGNYTTRWSGYVTPDFFAENLSYRTPISISARDNIGYLNDVDFDLDVATITVRELIVAAFNRIAEDYPMSLAFETTKQTEDGILAIDATISTFLLRGKTWYEAIETVLHDLGLQMRWVDNNTIAVFDISQLGEKFSLQRFNFIDNSGYREILPAWRELAQEQSYGVLDNFYKGQIDGESKLEYAANSAISSNVLLYQPKAITQWSRQGDVYFLNFYNSYNAEIDDDKQDAIFITGVAPSVANTDVLSKKMVYSQAVTEVDKQIKMTFSLNDTLRTPLTSQYSRGERNTLFLPYSAASGTTMIKTPRPYQLKYRFNVFLRANDGTNYVMREDWVEESTLSEQPFIEFLTDKLQTVDTGVTDGQGNHRFAYTGYNNNKEYSITIGAIPKAGTLEFVVYPWTFEKDDYSSARDAATYQRGAKISDITFSVQVGKTGVSARTQVGVLHNIAEKIDYSFGQVPQREGDVITYAGGFFKSDTITALQGFRRDANSTTYPLLELVGREIIHFNKKNYTKLSGTAKNLSAEPLMFNKLLVYKGRNYLPYACSLDVISNTMNITTMQEVEPYTTQSFVEIKSELVTGGGATISGGNNTALQYSAEVGNAKRISELNNASESEKKESYIVVDNASWNESKKVPLSEMEGLDEAQVEAYLAENKYAKQSWVESITKPIVNNVASIAGRVDVAEATIKTHTDSIAKIVTDIAANATAINTNAKAIAAIDNRVDALEALGFVLKDGYVYTEKTIVSKGEIISGRRASGSSSDVTGGGGISQVTAQMIADALGYVPYSSANPAGYINSSALNGYAKLTDIPSLSGYATQSWVEGKKYLTAHQDISHLLSKTDAANTYQPKGNYLTSVSWSDVSGKPSFATVATSGKYSDLSGLPTIPTNNNQLTNGAGYITSAALNGYATESWVGANYLGLGGGTISGNYNAFTLNRNTANPSIMGFSNTAGMLGYLGMKWGNTPVFVDADAANIYDLLHSGNYSSYALPLSGGTMTGAIKIGGYTSFGVSDGIFYLGNPSYPVYVRSSGIVNINGNAVIHAGNIGSYNAGSATKLQTARTIWGQSFDGTADVKGDFFMQDILLIYKGNGLFVFGNEGHDTYLRGNNIRLQYGASANTGLLLNSSGNVLIGATTDNGAKLQVDGAISANGDSGSFGGYAYYWGNNNQYFLGSNSSNDFYLWSTTASYLRIGTNNQERVRITSSGNVEMYGNLTATGEVISSRRASSSDRRLKNNITYLDTADCLAMVRHIRPAEWDWKDNGKHSMGFIAQDVEHLMPYAVTSIKDDLLEQKLNLQYDQFIALAIGGVKAVDNEVERLKARVEYLENKIKEYEYGNYRN